MPAYVVRPHRDRDLYVYWSDVTESPHAWGAWAEVLDYLMSRPGPDRDDPLARMDRAKAMGSSALWPTPDRPIYGWDDDTFVYQQRGTLTRDGVAALCQRFVDANPGADEMTVTPDVTDLLTPFEDEVAAP